MNKEVAIIMAAGLGTRMRPITNSIAKPLIKINNTPMIETIINGLEKRKINHIYIVVGYKKEQFYYLLEKYNNISLIENKEYNEKNNISSLKAVGSILGSCDCFICESDLFIMDDTIFNNKFNNSCYFGKNIEENKLEWGFNVEGNRITKIKLDKLNNYNMAGISYWKQCDAELIRHALEKIYCNAGHENLYWDQVVDKIIKDIYLTVNLIENNKIVEIDSYKELVNLKKYIKHHNY